MTIAVMTTFAAMSAPAQSGGSPSETAQSNAAGEPPFDLTDAKRIKSGEETFNATCASYCHGQNPTLFIDRTGLTEEYVYDTIRDGGKGATPMPPWGDVFTREEIWELVAYIKSLGQW